MNRQSIVLRLNFAVLLILISFSLTVSSAEQQGLTSAKLESWLKAYEEAWETLDADKAAQLFTKDASYRDDPYKDPHIGQEGVHKYWTAVTADQKDVDFTFEILSVFENTGIAHWHSELLQPSSGATIILDGIFVLEFSQEGLCRDLKEWWHLKVIPAE